MSEVSADAIAHAVHQIGVLIWVGSLFFVRLILLPVTSTVKNHMVRMRLRLEAYKRMFRWGWVGLVLTLGSGLLLITSMESVSLPLHVQVMASIAAIMFLLHLAGYLAFLLNMDVAVAEERLIGAAKNNFWIRKLIWVNLFLGLVAAILGAAGAHLFG